MCMEYLNTDENLKEALDEAYFVSENMIKYGGGFVKALGQALARADMFNARKIKRAFPEYWEKYLIDR